MDLSFDAVIKTFSKSKSIILTTSALCLSNETNENIYINELGFI